jgi:hypothetical protein
MEITEFQDGRKRCPCWELPNLGWEDLSTKLDAYLSEAIAAIADAYTDLPAAWIQLNYWADSGRLIVYPSDDGPFGNRTERVCFQLFSDYLQHEFDRVCELPGPKRQVEWNALGNKLWSRVGECLKNGRARRALSIARASHPMKLAAFDYDAGEGLFHLSNIDISAYIDMKQQLAEAKKRHGMRG